MKDADLKEALGKLRSEKGRTGEVWCDEAGKWYFEVLTEEAADGE